MEFPDLSHELYNVSPGLFQYYGTDSGMKYI